MVDLPTMEKAGAKKMYYKILILIMIYYNLISIIINNEFNYKIERKYIKKFLNLL